MGWGRSNGVEEWWRGVEWWSIFFTELIEIQGMSKFGQQLAPLMSNICGDDSRGQGLGDGMSGRG